MTAWAILGGSVLIAGLLGISLLIRARRKTAGPPPESITTAESKPAIPPSVTANPGESRVELLLLVQQAGEESNTVDTAPRSAGKAEENQLAQESLLAIEAEARRVVEEARARTEAMAHRRVEESGTVAEEEEHRAGEASPSATVAGTQPDFAAEEGSRIAGESEAAAEDQSVLEDSRAVSHAGTIGDETIDAMEPETRRAAEASRVSVDPGANDEATQAQLGAPAANELGGGDDNRLDERQASLDVLDDSDDDTQATIDEQDDVAEASLADKSLNTTVRNSPRRGPPIYRPPNSGPPIPGQRSSHAPTLPPNDRIYQSRRAASVAVRLTFERGGFWNVRLLPTRPENLPESCTVRTGDGSIELLARDEEWYQDTQPDGIGDLLRSGFVWTETNTEQEWVFAAGRDILVLATGTVHIGFVSTARLTLGRQHAVLCTTSQLSAVEHALRQAGCGEWRQFHETHGTPHGWVILCGLDEAGRARGLVPERAVPQEGDTLDALRPLPALEITLEGGVPLGYNSWLAGAPPAIRVYGAPDNTSRVLIDAKEATLEDGAYVAAGWDEVGEHQIWCNGVSRSYTLVQRQERPKSWSEYSFPAPDKRGRVAICGPLVRPVGCASALDELAEPAHTVVVNSSNPVLLGATPGDVLITVPPAGIHARKFLAYPSFAPIWALPLHPLRCNKGAIRVLLVGNSSTPPQRRPPIESDKHSERAVERWWQLIRDARKKGLSVEPGHPDAVSLWRQYTASAESQWKTSR